MSRFDRYLLSQLLALFGFFSLVLVSIYWINQAVQLFEQLISDGQSATVFLAFTALTLPNVIRMVLPVSAFAAAVYVTNRLSNESELVVMQATGFSPWRLARPALFFGIVVAVLLSILSHVLVPASRAELTRRKAEIAENVTARFLNAGTFQHPASGVTLYIRDITPVGELLDVYLSDTRNPASRTTYTAKRALLVKGESGPKLVMFEGMAQTLRVEGKRLFVTRFEDFTYDIGSLITAGRRGRPDLRELPTSVLLGASEDQLSAANATRAAFEAEAHSRIAQPLTAATFAVIGFAALLTGAFSRFGVWRQVVLAVGVLIVVQMVSNVAAAAAQGQPGLWPLVYVPVAVGALAGAALLWAAGRPRGGRRARRGTRTGAEAAA